MISKLPRSLVFALVVLFTFSKPNQSKAQFSVDTTLTDFQLINNLVGLGVSFNNVQFQGDGQAIGFFNGGSGNLGFSSGVIISTGLAADANNNTNTFVGGFNTYGLTNIPELAAYVPGCFGSTNDGSILQFDFKPCV